MVEITEEEIKEYISKGGKLLIVTDIDSYRDGGTKVITCNYAKPIKYYIHMDNWTIHSDYPTTDENLVTDEILKKYLIQGVKNYSQKLMNEVSRIENLIYNLEKLYNG